MKKEAFVFMSPGFAANEADTTVLPFVQTFVKCFVSRFPEKKVIVISFQFPFERRNYRWYGAEIIAIGGKNKPQMYRLRTWIKACIIFVKLRREYEIKGIFSFWLTECALVGQWLSRLFNIKQISWMVGQDAKASNQYLKRLQLRNNNIIALSPFLVKELNKTFTLPHVKVVQAGVDSIYIDTIEKANRGYDVLGVGSLIPLKNYSLFIEMIEKVKENFPNIRAAIIGDGTQRELLEKMVKEKRLEENVEIKGEMLNQDVLSIMKSSRVFLHTSTYEGQGFVSVEALYCGMNVLYFEVGHIYSDKQFYLCKNEEVMLDTLKKLLAEPNLPHESILAKSVSETISEVISLY